MSDRTLDKLAAAIQIELEYRKDAAPVTETGKLGTLIGSGSGRASGSLDGQIRWTLFEEGGDVSCPANMVGVIDTDQGERIEFETLGFFDRPTAGDTVWSGRATIRFGANTAHDLAGVTGFWEGTFDSRSYRHRYLVYLPEASQGPEVDLRAAGSGARR